MRSTNSRPNGSVGRRGSNSASIALARLTLGSKWLSFWLFGRVKLLEDFCIADNGEASLRPANGNVEASRILNEANLIAFIAPRGVRTCKNAGGLDVGLSMFATVACCETQWLGIAMKSARSAGGEARNNKKKEATLRRPSAARPCRIFNNHDRTKFIHVPIDTLKLYEMYTRPRMQHLSCRRAAPDCGENDVRCFRPLRSIHCHHLKAASLLEQTSERCGPWCYHCRSVWAGTSSRHLQVGQLAACRRRWSWRAHVGSDRLDLFATWGISAGPLHLTELPHRWVMWITSSGFTFEVPTWPPRKKLPSGILRTPFCISSDSRSCKTYQTSCLHLILADMEPAQRRGSKLEIPHLLGQAAM